MNIVILDYGCGNLHSVAKAFERAVFESNKKGTVFVTADADCVAKADYLVLPGVGAFFACRSALSCNSALEEAITEHVITKGKPFLGICVGMQLLASRGLEHQITEGLNWIAGDVAQITPKPSDLKIPHMGWNTLNVTQQHPVLKGIKTGNDGLHAYFVHSYAFKPQNERHILAQTDYGGALVAMVARDNIVGTQFHPEKSQKLGLLLLQNFLRWQP